MRPGSTRRHFFLGSLAALQPGRLRAAASRKVLIVLIDGFGPEYLEQSDMPNLRRMREAGFFRIGKAVIPTVTNVNNASLVTGSFPAQHGITTNFYYDRKTKATVAMESADFLLRPTLFEHFQKQGWKTALVSSKDKVRTLCSRGAGVVVSAEKPEREWIDIAGKQENMYSPEVNYWTFRAARHVLRTGGADLLYLSTTDYMMHTYAPEQEQSQAHLHTVDRLLGDIVDDHPGLELFLTADHGMNAKTAVVDPAMLLAKKNIACEAIPIVKDKHKVHHQDLGGCSYIYLKQPDELQRAIDVLENSSGIEEVHTGRAAAESFHLRQDRIGDLVALAAKDVAFGDLRIAKPETKVRSHGSRHEQAVPLVAYNRTVSGADLNFNLDLTRKLLL
ncbi:MAG: alkaline phosphatase family protein [Bryobacteraceae bacterium]|nr:alkaline phosphatase family protein [Bryobacteraceae bacterium]